MLLSFVAHTETCMYNATYAVLLQVGEYRLILLGQAVIALYGFILLNFFLRRTRLSV